jgi:hypothetical protein
MHTICYIILHSCACTTDKASAGLESQPSLLLNRKASAAGPGLYEWLVHIVYLRFPYNE